MSRNSLRKDIRAITDGERSALQLTETIETTLLSAEQLHEYDVFYAGFGKEYLKAPFKEQGRRFFITILTLCFAFVIALTLLALAFFCFWRNQYLTGMGILSVGLISTVGLFINYTKK
jgi:hypothetical protein